MVYDESNSGDKLFPHNLKLRLILHILILDFRCKKIL